MNKKYYIILGLSYLGFIGSWYISFLLASTLASSTLDYVLAFIITTVMQAASFYFFTKKQMGIEILLFSISILGTICYQYNIHSNILNESWNKSEAYNIALENRETKKNNMKLAVNVIKKKGKTDTWKEFNRLLSIAHAR